MLGKFFLIGNRMLLGSFVSTKYLFKGVTDLVFLVADLNSLVPALLLLPYTEPMECSAFVQLTLVNVILSSF